MKVFRDFQTRRDTRTGIVKSIFNYLETYFASFPGAQNASLHPERPQGMLKANKQQRPLADALTVAVELLANALSKGQFAVDRQVPICSWQPKQTYQLIWHSTQICRGAFSPPIGYNRSDLAQEAVRKVEVSRGCPVTRQASLCPPPHSLPSPVRYFHPQCQLQKGQKHGGQSQG